MISFSCPNCAHKLSVKDESAGRRGKCPKCQTIVAVPSDSALAGAGVAAPATNHGFEPTVNLAANAPSPASLASGANADAASTAESGLGRLGAYQLLRVLGEGGMGKVYEALHSSLEKRVALKVLPPDKLRTKDAVARFQREMKAVGKLVHPNIVGAHDAGEVDGTYFLVMEYVQGSDLSQIVKQLGRLPVADACELIRQAAVGLQEAHEHGMVHRDIKPSNLMLTRPARKRDLPVLKILDLGLALIASEQTQPARELTSTGQVMGTVDYMAPEQGGDSHLVDIRADIYALGATLYKLLAGSAPFDGPNYDSIVKKLRALALTPPRPIRELRPEVPEALAAVLHRMLAKEPGERLATPDELAEALAPFCRGCDLRALLARVTGEAAEAPGSQSAIPTGPHLSASQTPTDPTMPAVSATSAADPSPPPPRRQSRVKRIAAGLAGALLLLGVIVSVRNKEGQEVARIAVPDGHSVEVQAGTPDKNRQPDASVAPPPAIAPFDAAQAKKHQEAWARHLGVPVEYTNSIGMKFVLIPPGEFLMGGTATEIEETLRAVDTYWQELIRCEAPQHKVTLTQPIYLGIHEVTNVQYGNVMGKNSFPPDKAHHPVVWVTWNDAAEFCTKLSGKEQLKPVYFRNGETVRMMSGDGYRLPTEAQWEFACRAGTTTRFWTGDREESLAQAGWFGLGQIDRSHAVGELKANPLGLYDIHGNVWEWVQDSWDPAYYRQLQENPTPDPSGPPSEGPERVLRGGDWCYGARYCRASTRRHFPQKSHYNIFGFRVALAVDAVKATARTSTPHPPS